MSITLALAISHHIGLAGEYNEIHPSVRFTHDHFIAGAYLNSENIISPYIGARYEWNGAWIEGGIVGGYPYADVVPYARVGYDITDSMAIFAAPAYEMPDTVGAVIGVEFTFR